MWITRSVLGAAALALAFTKKRMEPKIAEAEKEKLRKQGLHKVDLLITNEEAAVLGGDDNVLEAVATASERRAQHERK